MVFTSEWMIVWQTFYSNNRPIQCLHFPDAKSPSDTCNLDDGKRIVVLFIKQQWTTMDCSTLHCKSLAFTAAALMPVSKLRTNSMQFLSTSAKELCWVCVCTLFSVNGWSTGLVLYMPQNTQRIWFAVSFLHKTHHWERPQSCLCECDPCVYCITSISLGTRNVLIHAMMQMKTCVRI